MIIKNLIVSAIQALRLEAQTVFNELQEVKETPEVQNYLFLQERLDGINKRIEMNREVLDDY